MRRLVFTPSAWQDYLWFVETDRRLLKKINKLIQEVLRTPLEGTGKPERLKADLTGYWSRRIDSEHRLVYEVTEKEIVVVACRFHYTE